MTKKPLIIANWKMNPKTLVEAKRLFDSVKKGIKGVKDAEVVICAPFVWLASLGAGGRGGIALGAQNCFWEQSGAYTGEVSPAMLKDIGCQYVILAHSERKIYFGESGEMINKKLKAVLKASLKPILCIGETITERRQDKSKEIIEEQLKSYLSGIAKHNLQDITFVYEPIWAISTFEGEDALPDDILSSVLLIRKIVSKIYDQKVAHKLKILYGGSAVAKNARDFVYEAGTDGLLVGGASLNATEFVNIVKNVRSKQ